MNNKELKDKIRAVLQDLIGTYTYSDGVKTAAIWIGGRVDSKITKVEGLEVLITATPETLHQRLSATEVRVEKTWEVRLVEHTSNKSLSLPIDLLLANFDTYRDPVRLNETDNVLEQATVYPRTVSVLTTENAHP